MSQNRRRTNPYASYRNQTTRRGGCVTYDTGSESTTEQVMAYEWKTANANPAGRAVFRVQNKKAANNSSAPKKKANPFVEFIYKVKCYF
jgi:hypothetical protein